MALEGVENDKNIAWFTTGGVRRRAIVLAVQRQPGTNTVEVVDRVLAQFLAQPPAASGPETFAMVGYQLRNSLSVRRNINLRQYSAFPHLAVIYHNGVVQILYSHAEPVWILYVHVYVSGKTVVRKVLYLYLFQFQAHFTYGALHATGHK